MYHDKGMGQNAMLDVDTLVIRTLIDNTTSKPDMMAEWGLSVLVKAGPLHILFDTGAGHPQVLLHNMAASGVSPAEIDAVVLSHGHQDHTGGLLPFLRRFHQLAPGKTLPIICHPAALAPQYIRGIGSFGCPYTQEEMCRLGARFHTITQPYALGEDVYVSGTIPMTNDYESTGHGFFRPLGSPFAASTEVADEQQLGFSPCQQPLVPDAEVLDDMCLYLRTSLGPVVILGCAHRGIINSLEHARAVLQSDSIYMVIGGTHLAGATDERMGKTVAALNALGVQKIGVSHCTGQTAALKISRMVGEDRFFFNSAGAQITFASGRFAVNGV